VTTAFLPNTRVSILDTGVVTTAQGDETENDVPVAVDLPAVWRQRTQRTWNPSLGRNTVVRGVRVTLRPGTVVRDGQRIKNQRTGEVGLVETVEASTDDATRTAVVVTLVDISR
jgi:hypothetical protein